MSNLYKHLSSKGIDREFMREFNSFTSYFGINPKDIYHFSFILLPNGAFSSYCL
ncbi:MAG: hypothetical protein QXJ06_05590 [Candidatus Aenigmatarchaeota archaeon]